MQQMFLPYPNAMYYTISLFVYLKLLVDLSGAGVEVDAGVDLRFGNDFGTFC